MATAKQLYNEDIKEEFLSKYPEGTANQYRYALYRAYETEELLNRDLFTFNLDEIKDALSNANHSTINSLNLTYSAFKYYLTWAAENGYSNSNIILIDDIKEEDLRKILNTKKLYITYDELKQMTKEIDNAQDLVCLWLPFEGVGGYKASEMVNLTYNNINWNTNELHLQDDKYGQRTVKVSDECLNIIRSAYQEETYTPNERNPRELIRNDYVIRNIVSKRTSNINGVNEHTIYRRLKKIQEQFELPFLNIKNIEKSGRLYMAKQLYERDGELTNKQLSEIAEQFGIRKVVLNGEETFNYSLIRNDINKDNLFNLYELDIEK